MTAQVVPFMSQADFLDPKTYKELGFWGAVFAIGMLLFVFCVIKGHIKIIGCGPNEGGIREFFGITLWKGGSGPHLHISGIFAFRKVSFASREVELKGQVRRGDTVYTFWLTIKVRVRNTKESIRLRVYKAEDLNRTDAENDEAIKQVTSLLQHIARKQFEAGADVDSIEKEIEDEWGKLELAELHGTATDHDRSTYGYEILWTDPQEFVEREFSEIARALRGRNDPEAEDAVGAVLKPSFGERAG